MSLSINMKDESIVIATSYQVYYIEIPDFVALYKYTDLLYSIDSIIMKVKSYILSLLTTSINV